MFIKITDYKKTCRITGCSKKLYPTKLNKTRFIQVLNKSETKYLRHQKTIWDRSCLYKIYRPRVQPPQTNHMLPKSIWGPPQPSCAKTFERTIVSSNKNMTKSFWIQKESIFQRSIGVNQTWTEVFKDSNCFYSSQVMLQWCLR